MSQPIANFFKSKKSFVQEKVSFHVNKAKNPTSVQVELENSVAKNVGATIQQENTQQQCSSHDVEKETVLRKKIKVLESNLKEAKVQLKKSANVNLEKDFKISCLMNEVNEKSDRSDNYLEGFQHTFDKIELKDIKSVGPGQKNDSNFILKVLRKLYKNEEEKLKDRSAVGRTYRGEKKTEISFEKKGIMTDMLSARLKFELNDDKSVEFVRRLKNLNKLIKSGIHNILQSAGSQDAGKKRRREDIESSFPAHKKIKSGNFYY